MRYIKEALLILVLISPVAYLLLNWAEVPDPMPSHIGPEGISTMEKRSFLGLYSLVALGLYFLMKWGIDIAFTKTKGSASDKFFMMRALIALIFTFAVLNVMGLTNVPFSTWGQANLFMVTVTLVMCNYLPMMTEPNYIIGVKLPWTLNSEYVWTKTHRHIGKIWFILSIASLVALIFLPEGYQKSFLYLYVGAILIHSTIYSAVIAILEQRSKRGAH